jgi:hypothetical protein
MANRASLIIAIRYMHPSQTQKARRYLRICTGRPCRFTRPTIFPWSRRNRDGNEEMHRQINDEARRIAVNMGQAAGAAAEIRIIRRRAPALLRRGR